MDGPINDYYLFQLINIDTSVTPPTESFLIQQDTDFILQQTGDKILLQE